MKSDSTHTGFVAYYRSGQTVYELNQYKDASGRLRATNWSEVNLEEVDLLELWWHGAPVTGLLKTDLEVFSSWVFFHTGISDGKESRIQSRSIGFMAGGSRYLVTVDEKTGRLTDTSALSY